MHFFSSPYSMNHANLTVSAHITVEPSAALGPVRVASNIFVEILLHYVMSCSCYLLPNIVPPCFTIYFTIHIDDISCITVLVICIGLGPDHTILLTHTTINITSN